jgi:CRISPR/Cas system-associated exonuclease Cas4 (RecB family)
MRKGNVSASEVSEFVFCRRAWWLKYQMGAVASRAAQTAETTGRAWHRRQGRRIARVAGLKLVGSGLVLFGVILLVFHLLGWAR